MKCLQPGKIAPVLAPPALVMQPLGGAFSSIPKSLRSRLTRPSQLPKLCVLASNTGDAGTQNVDRRAGRTTYRPSSYSELLGDAVEAIRVGLENGLTKMEVEFPAVANMDGEFKIKIILVARRT